MKEALEDPNRQLHQTLYEQFGIGVQHLDFVPIGESSWLYRATDSEGQLFAVKVQRGINPAVDEARRMLEEFDYPYVPRLLLSKDGGVQVRMEELYLSVEEYIEHIDVKAHDATPDENFLVTLGKSLCTLHDIEVQQEEHAYIPTETFRSQFLSPAKDSIVGFSVWSEGKPEAQTIKGLLTEKADVIEALFERSIKLGAKLAQQQPILALTHGDVHFGNTLESKNGELYIIDWDSTMIAGVGHDLMYFSDEQLIKLSIGYGKDLLAEQDNLQYYRNHLMLRFVWFWLNKAMTTSSPQDLEAVTRTITSTFDGSAYLKRSLGAKTVN